MLELNELVNPYKACISSITEIEGHYFIIDGRAHNGNDYKAKIHYSHVTGEFWAMLDKVVRELTGGAVASDYYSSYRSRQWLNQYATRSIN